MHTCRNRWAHNRERKTNKAELHQLLLTNFKKDLLQYERQETLDKFEVNVPNFFVPWKTEKFIQCLPPSISLKHVKTI